ncbi:uncharacterized protein TEOVI_000801600 [Trypanosoma equiperdum]|uniref:Uncharacterized protein n=2 Tax=Trypanozoon TaxID=39700 RepID=Q57X27_TRYB2|nr:hypothetical protein, conserved [Trypanosoma brucei brucei TREU927]AAX69864.1 hypothetical protein, conserved [Trypanosoma brucei]AAZ13319.1 hypothetical protein, conserved [Trypanosoma brucei brucei TREU927]SCU67192.1 hypothetical protein, conserved [Trypanosoma equiperdum]
MVFFVRVTGKDLSGNTQNIRLLFPSKPTLYDLTCAIERYFTTAAEKEQKEEPSQETPYMLELLLLLDEYRSRWVELYSSGQLTTDCLVHAFSKQTVKALRGKKGVMSRYGSSTSGIVTSATTVTPSNAAPSAAQGNSANITQDVGLHNSTSVVHYNNAM